MTVNITTIRANTIIVGIKKSPSRYAMPARTDNSAVFFQDEKFFRSIFVSFSEIRRYR